MIKQQYIRTKWKGFVGITLLVLSFSVLSCNDDDGPSGDPLNIVKNCNARMGKSTCPVNADYTGFDVYASISNMQAGFANVFQPGVHFDNDSGELVLNFAVHTGDIDTGSYPLMSNGQRVSWLVYYPTDNEADAYTSFGEGNMKIDSIDFVHNGDVSNFMAELSDVNMSNGKDTMVICAIIYRWYK
jgi:hypothetical protein